MNKDEEDVKLEVHEIEAFMRSRVWKVIVSMLASRSITRTEENNSLDPMSQPTQIARNQGAISEYDWIVDLPDMLLDEAKDKITEEEETNNG